MVPSILCITNNLNDQLSDQKVLFHAIQLSKGHLFVHCLKVKQFYFMQFNSIKVIYLYTV